MKLPDRFKPNGAKDILNIALVTSIVAIAILMFILGNSMDTETNYLDGTGKMVFNDPWMITMEGETKVAQFPLSFKKSDRIAILTNTLPKVMDNTMLVFYDQYQWIRVDIDGEMVYETTAARMNGTETTLGTYYISVPMYSSYAGKQIKVYLTRFESGRAMYLNDIRITTYSNLIDDVLRENAVNIICLIVILLEMVFCIVIRISSATKKWINDKKLKCVFAKLAGVFLCSGVWMVSDSGIFGLMIGNQALGGMLIYYSLALLPLLIIDLISDMLGDGYAYLKYMRYVFAANIIIQALLFATGVLDLYQMLPATHILILVTIFLGAAGILKDKKKEEILSNKIVVISGIIVTVAVIGSLAAYMFKLPIGYRTIAFVGLAIFEMLLMQHAYISLKALYAQHSATLEEDKLNHTDGLTGFYNRKAFEEELEKYDDLDTKNDSLLVLWNLKGLRDANETGGRNKGDELIVNASAAVTGIFGDKGRYYRLSGDEFAIIIHDWNENYAAYHRKLGALAEEKDIHIAAGAGHLLDDGGNKRPSYEWKHEAETNVYADKSEKKFGSERDIKGNYKSVLEDMLANVEGRSEGMCGHSETVKQITMLLASHIDIGDENKEALYDAAKFHDIGMICVPQEILEKNGHLNNDEYEEVKKHSVIGDGIFAHAAGMQRTAVLIRSHHERFDGRGYPDGLKENEIPIGARLIAVADAIDAITSERPYRKAYSLSYCFDELYRCSGTMFDPAVVETASTVRGQIEEILDSRDKKRKVLA